MNRRLESATIETPIAAIRAFHRDLIAIRDLPPSMGAEDFSFMLQVRPGAYLRLGQGRADNSAGAFLHNTRYDFNDDVIPLGSALFAALAERALAVSDE